MTPVSAKHHWLLVTARVYLKLEFSL